MAAFLAGEGNPKGLATKAGVHHRLVQCWRKMCHPGALPLDAVHRLHALSRSPANIIRCD